MEFEYTTYRNREGTFYRPAIDVTFKYASKQFPYKSALVDTGSDYVMLPLSIAEALGAEPDLERMTALNCACGGTFTSYASRYPLEIVIDHPWLKLKSWETHVQFIDAEVPVLLGNRGFLDRFNATFYGKRRVMKLAERK